MEENRHSNTLFVGGLPATVTTEQLETTFGEIGPLKRCFVVSGKGVGFVTFAFKEDADSASAKIKTISGKKINIKLANKKIDKKGVKKESVKTESGVATTPTKKKSFPKKKKNQHGNTPKNQEGRLILRNLSFKAEQDDIKKEFGKFGNITEVNIPTKPDGKKMGFGFVQFEKLEEAEKAIKNLNAKAFMGRPIAVDYAIPRNEYRQIKEEKESSDEEDYADAAEGDNDEEEDDEDMEEDDDIMVEKQVSTTNTKKIAVKKESKVEEEDDNSNQWMESGGSEDEEEEEDKKNEDDVDEDEESEDGEKSKKKKMKHRKSDVDEGKTLFIRNLNFTTTSSKLEEVFSQFGALEYATVCVDQVTQHSKGSGFVKFKKKEDAEGCLKLVEESPKDGGIIIDEFKIVVSSAISKNNLNREAQQKKLDKVKCNRNLYLTREGLIRPGTKAAEGVSQQDLAQRTAGEVWKRQMLKNLHISASKTRLCVRNLPQKVDDSKLKTIFAKAAGADCKITEAKVMRHIGTPGHDGYYMSKGFGFINFTQHQHALKALRHINNNPDIFSSNRRPIVEFSLENMSALRAKAKRLEKSNAKRIEKVEADDLGANEEMEDEDISFAGTKSGEDRFRKGLPSHIGPKIRHGRKISRNLLKKQKLKMHKRSRKAVLNDKKKQKGYPQAKMKNYNDNVDKLASGKRKSKQANGGTKKKTSKWHSG